MIKRTMFILCAVMLVCPVSAGNANGGPWRDLTWGVYDTGVTYHAFDLGQGLGDYARAGVLLPDGRLLVAGVAARGEDHQYDFAFKQRWSSIRGLPDLSFGTAYGATTVRNIAPIQLCIGVMRLNADGSTDTSFGAGSGRVCHVPSVDEGDQTAQGNALHILADGRILITGTAYHGGGTGLDMMTLRLLPNGAIDTSFGENGWAFVGFDQGHSFHDFASALVVDTSDRIVIAGYLDNKPDLDMGVARLLPDGAIDTSFGSQGRTLIDFSAIGPGTGVTTHSLLLLPDQRLLIGGSFSDGRHEVLAMLRPDGTLDPWFGTGGRFLASTNEDPSAYYIRSGSELLRHQDYLYLVGSGWADEFVNSHDFATARFILPLFRAGFELPVMP